MPDPATFSLKDLFAEVAHFQQVMDQVHTSLRLADKAKLGELLAHCGRRGQKPKKSFPPFSTRNWQTLEKAKAEMEDLSEQVTQKLAELQTR